MDSPPLVWALAAALGLILGIGGGYLLGRARREKAP